MHPTLALKRLHLCHKLMQIILLTKHTPTRNATKPYLSSNHSHGDSETDRSSRVESRHSGSDEFRPESDVGSTS